MTTNADLYTLSSPRGASWTSDQLCADVRREARIPDSEITNADILREATSAIWSEVQEPIVTGQADTGWFLRHVDIPGAYSTAAAPSVASQAAPGLFPVPMHAAANAIRHVEYLPGNGNEVRKLALEPPESSQYFQQTDGDPAVYFLQDRHIRVLPRPSSGTIRIWYQQRHPELVTSTDALAPSAITDVALDAGDVVVTIADSVADTWPSVHVGDPLYGAGSTATLVDVYDPVSGSYVVVAEATTIASPATVVHVGSVGVFGSVRNTMIVAPTGYASHVLLPLELRKPLAQLTGAAILRSLGDEAGANSLQGAFERAFSRVTSQLVPRSKGVSYRWISQNSPLRSGRSRGRYGY